MTETPHRRTLPVYVLVSVLFVVLVALAIWSALRSDREGPQAAGFDTGSDAAAIAALVTRIEAIDGVESAEIEQIEEQSPDVGPLLRLVMTVDLESFAGPRASQATSDEARAALVDAGIRGIPETWIVDEIPGTSSTLRIGMNDTGMRSVFAGVSFLDGGATSVLFDATATAVTVRAIEDLEPIAQIARDAPHGIVSLSTDDQLTRYIGGDYMVPPPVPAVALIAQTAARDEVVDVSYDAAGASGDASPTLTVRVDGDVAPTAAWLRASGQAELLGSPVQFVVDGASARETGWVSELEPVGPDPAFAAQDALDTAAAEADGIRACTGEDLTPTLAGFDAAAGSRFAIIVATNVSDSPCAVDGRPELSFLRASGTAPEVALEPYMDGGNSARVVTAPGSSVQSLIRWGAMSTANDPDVTTSILVKTVVGADPVRLSVTSHLGAESGVDILDGATVEVGAWATDLP